MIGIAAPRRRAFLARMAASLGVTLVLCGSAGGEEHRSKAPSVTPAAALQRLVDGNRRFASGKPSRPHQDLARRNDLAAGQHPFATIVGCSDSRVPSELVLDQGIGDLFVVRVAGNVGGPDDLGSIEYAAIHLDVPLVLVMGHESCGAVTAALDPDSSRAREAAGVQAMLSNVAPSLEFVDRSLPKPEQVHIGVEANVRRSVALLRDAPELKAMISTGVLDIVGCVYDLQSGKIRILH